MNRGVVCSLLAVLLVAAGPAGAATPDGALGLPQEFDPDTVSLTAAVQGDGDATWTFTYRMRLPTDDDVAAFQSLQADVRNNSSAYTSQFRERIGATVAATDDGTARNMSVSNVHVSTRLNTFNQETLGVVTYSFTWSGFAVVDGDRLVAGDALEGFYLDNETSLRVSWPESYGLDDVDPTADRPSANAVEWPGPKEFATGEPRVVVSPSAEDRGDAGADTQTPVGETDVGEDGNLSALLVPAAVGAAAALAVLGVAGWYYREQYGGLPPAAASGGDDEPDGERGGPSGAPDAGAAVDEPPEELLSNEERVKRFLREEGGRAKQQAVVDAMGWTEAKTSQVVSELRENDDVESFRIGRENVLKLADGE